MNWEAIGAVGEIIGAIGVIFSLIYLSIQIRTQSAESHAATIQSFTDQQLTLNSELIRNAKIWDKVIKSESLSEGEETRIGMLLFNMIMIENENSYFQFKSGYLPESVWAGRIGNIENLAALPIFETWRSSLAAQGRDREFLKIIDDSKK